MNYLDCQTMADVVSHLRVHGAGALLELFQLHVVLGEIMLNGQMISAAAAEIAAESSVIATSPHLATKERLQALAKAAAQTSVAINSQLQALSEVQRGIDAWNIASSRLRLV